MNEDWQAQARTRLEQAWETGDACRLWTILRNPDNTTSRHHCRTLCPEAPAVRAPIKVWQAFLDQRFPALPAMRTARQAVRDQEDKARQERWQRESLYLQATLGPQWQHRESDPPHTLVGYAHALAFVEGLMRQGYIAETVGIGTVRFTRADGRRIGPLRNKHINAALAYRAMPARPEAAPSSPESKEPA